jgi:predicted kinase
LRKFVVNIIGYGYSVNTTIIVDNTNTTVAEIAPYAALALAYGHDLEIVILNISKENLTKVASRNIHGVPQNVVEGQFNRLELLKEQLPPWWPVKNIEIEF